MGWFFGVVVAVITGAIGWAFGKRDEICIVEFSDTLKGERDIPLTPSKGELKNIPLPPSKGELKNIPLPPSTLRPGSATEGELKLMRRRVRSDYEVRKDAVLQLQDELAKSGAVKIEKLESGDYRVTIKVVV